MGDSTSQILRVVEEGQVPPDWNRITVQELLEDGSLELVQDGNHGGNYPKQDEFADAGIPLITGADIEGGVVNLRTCKLLNPDRAAKLRIGFAKTGDVLLSHKGTMGKTAIVPVIATPYIILNPQLTLYRVSEDSVLDRHFLKYFFDSALFQSFLTRISAISTISTLSLGVQKQLEICFPSKTEQRAIAHILGTLDDKIELNRRMNETLEAIARALFKSWFNDTDETEIPRGWREGKVEELATLSRETIDPSEFPNETFDHYSIPAFDEGRLPKAEPGGQIQSNKFIVPANAVLLSKLNPRIPRVWLPSISKSHRSICSTEFLVAIPQPGVSREYLYGLFSSQSFLELFSTLVTGTSGSHQRVKPEYLTAIDMLTPPKKLIGRFTETVAPIYQRTAQNIEESRTLSTLRDTLLPKLITGELRIRDAHRFGKGRNNGDH